MSSGIWIAASGASSQITALDVTANNLANASTPGYKAQTALFQEHLIQAAFVGDARQEMRYTGVAEVSSDMRPGSISPTGRPLDAAIAGDGFFTVQTPEGERYTRAGAFHVAPGGGLVTPDGHAIVGTTGKPLFAANSQGAITLGEDGSLRAGKEVVGRLKIVTFSDSSELEAEGTQLYRATERSGIAKAESDVELHVGAVEMPNISIVKGMTQLVTASRTFETLQKAVEVFSEMERRAANDIVGAR